MAFAETHCLGANLPFSQQSLNGKIAAASKPTTIILFNEQFAQNY